MDLHVPPELEATLNRLAAESGRNADQVALGLLANSVREGRLLDEEEVASRIDQRYRG
jgi:hypothetical protein